MQIEVFLDGGVIQDILFPKELDDVMVVVYDYDTEGADRGGLEDDGRGNKCYRTEWSNRQPRTTLASEEGPCH